MQVEFYPRQLKLCTLSALIMGLFILPSVNYHVFAQEGSVYTLEVDGVAYDIPYSVEKGKLVNAQVEWDKRTITLDFDPPANGIVMEFPRDIVDQMANINVLIIVDDNNKFVDYKETVDTVSCDSRTVSVNFKDDVSRMQIIGSFLRSPDEPKPDASMELDVDGKIFKLTTSSDSRVCDWKFIKEERKLEISVQGGTYLQVITANELIGRPYTVLVDGESVDFKMHNASDWFSTIVMKYDNASTVDIIGTTAIPEFPISIMVAAVAMVSTVMLLRLNNVKQKR